MLACVRRAGRGVCFDNSGQDRGQAGGDGGVNTAAALLHGIINKSLIPFAGCGHKKISFREKSEPATST